MSRTPMLKWLRELLLPHNLFRVPELKRKLPVCRIRPFCPDDFDRCAEIYRLNEGTHFPTGFFENFSILLTDEKVRPLVLVAETENGLSAFGGIAIHIGHRIVNLSYGMVHPKHQRLGYGTAVLLARLAALPQPSSDWIVALSTAGPSAPFYERFGFRFHNRYEHPVGIELDMYTALFNANGWTQCLDLLKASSVTFDPTSVTVPEKDLLGL
jgi:ribosomal protein S18 acetylase RimI-like enzyme